MNMHLREPVDPKNPIVFLDINIGEEFAGRIIIELRKDVVPRTAENFRALCTGERGIGQLGKPLHYKGNRFHKVTRVFVAQSGDVVNNDGTSGESIYGPIFEDENFTLTHNEEGIVSMVNYGEPNTNNSQFFITSVDCANLNGINVVVGRVLRGLGIVADMEQNTTDDGNPTKDIIIVNCGELDSSADWGITCCDETADTLPPYPQDWPDKNNQQNSSAVIQLLTVLRQSGNYFFEKSRFIEARSKYRKANRYYNFLRKNFDWQQLEKYRNAGTDHDLRAIDAFSVVNNINIAAVELKLCDYASAKYACCEAIRLDPQCSKAYYRRGQAHIALKNYDEAINDLRHAHELVPDNKQVLNELNRAKQLLSQYNRSQMNALKNLFN